MSSEKPHIAPNRHHLDNRFPSLSFTITSPTQQEPQTHCEVLLTTERSLFDARNATYRNGSNFYASRQDSGLIEFTNGEAVYMVPVPVLKAFVKAEPRPSTIYYTAITYSDSHGTNPKFAHDPYSIASNAPSVGISADFQAQTLSSVLGIPTEKLWRVGGKGRSLDSQLPITSDDQYPEDGYMMPLPDSIPADTVSTASYQFGSNVNGDKSNIGPQDGYERNHLTHGNGSAIAQSESQYPSDGYEDGYSFQKHHNGGNGFVDEQWWPQAQESVYPYGASEPTALVDDEYAYDDLQDEDIYEPYPSNDGNGLTHSSGTYTHDAFHDDFEYDDGYGALGANGQDEDYAERYEDDGYAETHSWSEPPSQLTATPVYDNNDEEYDDIYDDYGDPPPYQSLSTYALNNPSNLQPLTIEDRKDIIEQIAHFESGNDYSKINADGEFEGKFGENHSAYHTYHIGLSYGIVQFTQDGGNLGRLLVMMRDRDRNMFNRIFGDHANDLIRVTTASGPISRKTSTGRSARVQPVDGADLWKEPWLSRFREAGRQAAFQSAQNEAASTFYIEPILPFAGWLGLNTDRALTIVADRSVQMGPGGARRWIIGVVGPIQSSAQRQQAMQVLGYRDLRAFQQASHGLDVDGDWGPQSHAAMIGALRQLGASSPIAIPSRDQMLDMLVRQSSSKRWGHRVRKLRESTDFNDAEFELVSADLMPHPAATIP